MLVQVLRTTKTDFRVYYSDRSRGHLSEDEDDDMKNSQGDDSDSDDDDLFMGPPPALDDDDDEFDDERPINNFTEDSGSAIIPSGTNTIKLLLP